MGEDKHWRKKVYRRNQRKDKKEKLKSIRKNTGKKTNEVKEIRGEIRLKKKHKKEE